MYKTNLDMPKEKESEVTDIIKIIYSKEPVAEGYQKEPSKAWVKKQY